MIWQAKEVYSFRKEIKTLIKNSDSLASILADLDTEMNLFFKEENKILIKEDNKLLDIYEFFFCKKNVNLLDSFYNFESSRLEEDKKYNEFMSNVKKHFISKGFLLKNEILSKYSKREDNLYELLENELYEVIDIVIDNPNNKPQLKTIKTFFSRHPEKIDEAYKENWKRIESLDLYDSVSRGYSENLGGTYLDYLLEISTEENLDAEEDFELLDEVISKLKSKNFNTIYHLILQEISDFSGNETDISELEFTSKYTDEYFNLIKRFNLQHRLYEPEHDKDLKDIKKVVDHLRRILLIGFIQGNTGFMEKYLEYVEREINLDLINYFFKADEFTFEVYIFHQYFWKDQAENEFVKSFVDKHIRRENETFKIYKESILFLFSKTKQKNINYSMLNTLCPILDKEDTDKIMSSYKATPETFYKFSLYGDGHSFLEKWFAESIFYNSNNEFNLYQGNLKTSYYFENIIGDSIFGSGIRKSFVKGLKKLKNDEFFKVLSQSDYSNRTLLHYSFITNDIELIEVILEIVDQTSEEKDKLADLLLQKDIFELTPLDYNSKLKEGFIKKSDEKDEKTVSKKGDYNFLFAPSLLDILIEYLNGKIIPTNDFSFLEDENKDVINILESKLKRKKGVSLSSIMKLTDNEKDDRALRKYLKSSFGPQSYKAINLIKRLGYSIIKAPNKSETILELFEKNPVEKELDKIIEIIIFNLLLTFKNLNKENTGEDLKYNEIKDMLFNMRLRRLNDIEKAFLKKVNDISIAIYGEPIIELIETLFNHSSGELNVGDYGNLRLPDTNSINNRIESYIKNNEITLDEEKKIARIRTEIEGDLLIFLSGQGYIIKLEATRNFYFKSKEPSQIPNK